MQPLIRCLGALGLAVMLTATAHAEQPAPEGNAVWQHLLAKEYSTWGQFDDHKGMQKGNGPHGATHKVYANRLALDAHGGVPPGAMLVKDNFDTDGRLIAITVMYKVKGYNPEAGDWFWAKYTPEGDVLIAGKPGGCVGCHGQARSNHFTLTHAW